MFPFDPQPTQTSSRLHQIHRPERFYKNGEQISCQGFIYAFLQKSGGAPGGSILTLAQDLQNHGCKQGRTLLTVQSPRYYCLD